jgi:HD-GYP domain-containing protein (c-di-GMP phosphodiesterase class II)
MLRVAVHTPAERPQVHEFALADGARVSFGRDRENTIVLDYTYISRRHGEFVCEDGRWVVSDLGSKSGIGLTRNGTTSRIPPGARQALQDGDTLRILHTHLRIQVKPTAGDEEPLERDAALAALAATRAGDAPRIQEAERLDLLLALSRELQACTELRALLVRVASAAFAALSGARRLTVAGPDADGWFAPRFAAERGGTYPAPDPLAAPTAILEAAVERRVALAFNAGSDTTEDSLPAPRAASALAVPVLGTRGVLAVLVIESGAVAAFHQPDLDFAVLLAHQAAAPLERARFQTDVRHLFEGFVDASVTAIEARDPTTSGHSRRVAVYALGLADAVTRTQSGPLAPYAFSEAQLTELSYAALLHDFGRLGVPECLLVKGARLLPQQLERIEQRFRLIRSLSRSALLLGALTGVAPAGTPPLAWVEERMREQSRRLDEALDLVRRVNAPGALAPADLARIQALARATFIAEDGSPVHWLAPDELESLCVPEGTLTERERRDIESHVTHSFRVLQQIPWPPELEQVPEIVLGHHERLDGTGYPRGLRGDEILPQARLLSVVDVFDALTAADRPYRSAIPLERSLDMLRAEARASRIDTDLVELFIAARVWENCACPSRSAHRGADPWARLLG